VVLDMDMLYNTKERGAFCAEWKTRNGENGEDLYAKYEPVRYEHRGDTIIGPKGPTGTDYLAYLIREKKDSIYKMTDRSLYGARNPFVKVHRKEEKLDGMSEEELARRLGWSLMSNVTECSCDRFETEEDCLGSGLGCEWRQLFESCHPPEMIDDGVPICSTTDAPTMSPTLSIDEYLKETEAPTIEPMQEGLDGNDPDTNYHSEDDITDENAGGDISEVQFVERNAAVLDVDSSSILTRMFKSREHVFDKGDVDDTNESTGNRLLLAVSTLPKAMIFLMEETHLKDTRLQNLYFESIAWHHQTNCLVLGFPNAPNYLMNKTSRHLVRHGAQVLSHVSFLLLTLLILTPV